MTLSAVLSLLLLLCVIGALELAHLIVTAKQERLDSRNSCATIATCNVLRVSANTLEARGKS